MAHVEKRGQGRWRARYRGPDGLERSRTFDRKADAERFLTGIEHSKLAGTYVDPVAGRITLGAYAEEWLATRVHRASTSARVDSDLRVHILPHLGHRSLGSIRHTEVQGWVRSRSEMLSPGSVENVYRTLAAVFRAAVRDRIITVSPCEGVALPKRTHIEVVSPTVQQVRELMSAMPTRYRIAGVLAAGAGLRQGEALGLTVDRVDFLRRQLRVDRRCIRRRVVNPTSRPPSRRPLPGSCRWRTSSLKHSQNMLGRFHPARTA